MRGEAAWRCFRVRQGNERDETEVQQLDHDR
jgi:hypothetical protein